MTKEEVIIVLKRKQVSAIENANNDNYDTSWKHYYNGVVRGITEALEVIGMLDNDHNRTKS